jgi:hypothetical protein
MTRGRNNRVMFAAVCVSLALNTLPTRGQALSGVNSDVAASVRSTEGVVARTENPASERRRRNDDDRTGWMKKTFKDFRPGSCKAPVRGAPSASWPARGEAAVSFCQ